MLSELSYQTKSTAVKLSETTVLLIVFILNFAYLLNKEKLFH